MTSPRVRTVVVLVVALLVGAWVARAVARNAYYEPRGTLRSEIDDARDRIDRYQSALDDEPRVAAALLSFADGTLGGDLETVDHRLRTRLNRIAEGLGLTQVTVGTGAMRDRLSPARNEFRGRFRHLRDEVDFVELDGWINGRGSLEQALRLLDIIDAEPWLKRVNQYKLESKDDGAQVGVSIRLTTIFLPGRPPRIVPARSYDPAQFRQFVALVERNPFGLPAPSQAAAPPAAAPPADEPWRHWRLTGLTYGPTGPEAWLLNQHNGASRRLGVGDRFRDLVLLEIEKDRAVFEIGGERVVLTLGGSLSDRSGTGQ